MARLSRRQLAAIFAKAAAAQKGRFKGSMKDAHLRAKAGKFTGVWDSKKKRVVKKSPWSKDVRKAMFKKARGEGWKGVAGNRVYGYKNYKAPTQSETEKGEAVAERYMRMRKVSTTARKYDSLSEIKKRIRHRRGIRRRRRRK